MAKRNRKLAGTIESRESTGGQLPQRTLGPQSHADLAAAGPRVDREHLVLNADQAEFAAAVDGGASRGEILARLMHLLERFQAHFDSEEKLMRDHSFPGLQPHSEEHRQLIARLASVRDDVRAGVIHPCGALAVFVQRWFEEHISGADRLFERFLNQQKLQEAAGNGFPATRSRATDAA